MKDRSNTSIAILGLVLWSLPMNALAYIDPGSGALVVQALISGVFGFIFLARKTIVRAATRIFGKKKAQ